MFKHNKYKLHLISSNIADGASATVYRCGPFIDLCVGPHMRDTGKIGIFEIEEVRSSQEPTLCAEAMYAHLNYIQRFPPGSLWHAEMDSVYRIYGISIPKEEFLEDYSKIRPQDPEMSPQRPASDETELHTERTDETILNLETPTHARPDRNS